MKSVPVTVYLPDQKDVFVSRDYTKGNNKLGPDVFTYSRVAGVYSTCPGATAECESICYAKRIDGEIMTNYLRNAVAEVPPIPAECKLLRIHVSGDFDTRAYIRNWVKRLEERPDVTAWAYTRSWRVPELLPELERLRTLPNVQLFASMDPSTTDVPPEGWRRAWIWRDVPKNDWPVESRLSPINAALIDGVAYATQKVLLDGSPSYICPEETGAKKDCQSCRYCFDGKKHDVTFLEH